MKDTISLQDGIVVFGIGRFAEQIFRYLSIENIRVKAFTVEKAYCDKKMLHGLSVIPFEDLDNFYSKEDISILICVGYNKMNLIREQIYEKVKSQGYNIASFIHPTATVLSDDIGEGNIVLENASIGIGCRVGDGNIIYNNTAISHNVTINNFNYFSPSSTVLGGVTVNDGCFFGGNSTIKNDIIIEDHCLIGANAFVRHNTKKNAVIVPAKSVMLECDSFSLVDKLM